MKPGQRIVTGDPAAETRATQILAIALRKGAERASRRVHEHPRNIPIPPLLLAASRSVTLASVEAPNPPLEILALATRNTFELYLRLKHVMKSDANALAWRNEAVTDHLQIYEGILELDGPESAKTTLAGELETIRRDAAARGLRPADDLMRVPDLARDVGLKREYLAFYKFYSKFVHPSSFLVNRPTAATTPAFRSTLMFNLQVYGQLMLDELTRALGVDQEALLREAQQQLDAAVA